LMYACQIKKRAVIKDIKSAYFELGKIDQLIKILGANVELMNQAYRAAQAKYSAGEASQVEALKMQIELNRTENELQNMKDERSVQNLKLSLLLNSASDEVYVVDPLPMPSAVELAADIEKLPRLKMEYSSLEEMRAMKGAALSSYFPETMLKWKSQKYGALPGSNTLMLDFTLPLWFPLRQNRTLEEADENIAAAEKNYQAMKNMQQREIKDFSTAAAILRRKIKLYDSSLIISSKAAVESALAGYRSGSIDFMLLLDSIRQYFAIDNEYYEILADYSIKLAELEEIAGKN
ncbi:MAG: TolC family protein, partial [Candidatus Margulisbacteria bacterium]|nr:TolC family protein [Candidatus Margulisiibacteriota bacterium]